MRDGLKFVRGTCWTAVAIAAGGILIFSIFPALRSDLPAKVTTILDASQIGGSFRLTSHKGQSVDNAFLAGKPYLAFFGFTHCPDVCPTTLSELTDLMNELGSAADRLNALLITVDPERDTQELLTQYMTAFNPRILALRGNRAETDAVVKAFAAQARKVLIEAGDYTMDHTVGVYLMGANGKFIGMLDTHEPREIRLQKLRRLVRDPV